MTILTFPKIIQKEKVTSAFERLQKLRKQHPIGSVEEIKAWKNKN